MGYRMNAIVAASELFLSLSTPFDNDTYNFLNMPTILEWWLILLMICVCFMLVRVYAVMEFLTPGPCLPLSMVSIKYGVLH